MDPSYFLFAWLVHLSLSSHEAWVTSGSPGILPWEIPHVATKSPHQQNVMVHIHPRAAQNQGHTDVNYKRLISFLQAKTWRRYSIVRVPVPRWEGPQLAFTWDHTLALSWFYISTLFFLRLPQKSQVIFKYPSEAFSQRTRSKSCSLDYRFQRLQTLQGIAYLLYNIG